MSSSDVPSPFLNLSAVIRALRDAAAAWGGAGWLAAGLVMLMHRRLGQMDVRMQRLAARFAAGVVWRRVARAGGEAVGRASRVRGVRVWPGGFGWLVKAAGYRAAGYGCQLRAVLETPEMVALLMSVPQAARVLRPLCRALAIETSVLRPGVVAELAEVPAAVKRVRAPRAKVDWGRVPLPRGVLSWARREGFAKR